MIGRAAYNKYILYIFWEFSWSGHWYIKFKNLVAFMWFLAYTILNGNCEYGNSNSIVTAIISVSNIEYTNAPVLNANKNP